MFIKSFLNGFGVLVTLLLIALTNNAHAQFDPEQYKIISTDRGDNRYISTRGAVQDMMRNVKPQLAFNPEFSRTEIEEWQIQVRNKMKELMRFPDVPPQPAPKLLSKVKRTGYTVEKWEIYPQPGSVVPFLMLVPDGVSAKKPAPAVLCFPGSNRTKENLAGEDELYPKYTIERHSDRNRMAMYYALQGIVAVAIDNPGIGETSDLEKYFLAPNYDRNTFSRYLLDVGWHYLGLSAFQGQQILNWMKTLDFINHERIALSGHSLGTEPVMVLSVLNPDIHSIVFNDFLCRIITRAIVTTKPDEKGLRPQANWLGHCVPGLWKWFDYPDILASLAPRPLIITEGGATNDLELVKKSYQIMRSKKNVTIKYYPKYSDPKVRRDYEEIPEGITADEYLDYANVDAPNHYFKAEVAVPWLKHNLNKK